MADNMNEQIQELAEQARFTWVENDKDITGGVDLEKFAELIIRKCAEIAMREDHDPADCIKQHFGVKE